MLMSGMHRAIHALVCAGNNVLADHVLLEPVWVHECAELFADLPAWFVGIRCPLDVLEARERARSDRTVGQARAQFDAVHAHGVYDIELDTSALSPMDCAMRIRGQVLEGPVPDAFKRLRALAGGPGAA
jgi:chloramphenicol 3-O phosphotransferase